MLSSLQYAIVSRVAGTKRRVLEHFKNKKFSSLYFAYSVSRQATALVKNLTANVATNRGLFTRSFSEMFLTVATSV